MSNDCHNELRVMRMTLQMKRIHSLSENPLAYWVVQIDRRSERG
jgi:hypothetical protein